MKKFTLAVMVLITVNIFPAKADYDFKVNNLYYTIESMDNRTCAVCAPPQSGKYQGNIVIPQTVVYNGATFTMIAIDKNAFWDCPITSVKLPNSLQVIRTSAFSDCKNLSSVKFPEGLKEIGAYAFCRCKSLTTVNIPSSIEGISACAFEDCYNLSCKIVIPPSCRYIGEGAFYCGSLNVIIEDSNKPIALYSRTFGGGKYIYIGREITSDWTPGEIQMHDLSGLYRFDEITIGDLVKSLPHDLVPSAYYRSWHTIDIMRIGYSLHSIKRLNADILKAVYVNNPDPSSFTFDFTNKTYASAILYVPRGAKSSYQGSPTWKKFLNIQEYDAPIPPSVQARIKEEQRKKEEQQRKKAEEEELTLWKSACKRNTIDSYNAFINKYPQSRNKSEALKKISELTDKKNWKNACRVNTIDAYMKYINEGGLNKNNKAEIAIDKLYWQQASIIDNIEAYQEYLSRETNFPKTLEYTANNRIDQIRKQTKLIEIAETIKDKKQAYDKVQEARMLGGLQSKLEPRALPLEEPYAYELARSKKASLLTKQNYCSKFKSVAPLKHIENINKQIEKMRVKN